MGAVTPAMCINITFLEISSPKTSALLTRLTHNPRKCNLGHTDTLPLRNLLNTVGDDQ